MMLVRIMVGTWFCGEVQWRRSSAALGGSPWRWAVIFPNTR